MTPAERLTVQRIRQARNQSPLLRSARELRAALAGDRAEGSET